MKKILKIIGAIVGLLIVGFIVLMFVVDTPPDKTVLDYLDLIKTEKLDEAWNTASSKLRESVTKQEFTTLINEFPIWKNHDRVTIQGMDFEEDITIVRGIMHQQEKTTPFDLLFVQEGNAWRVAGIQIDINSAERISTTVSTPKKTAPPPITSDVFIGTEFDEEEKVIGKAMTNFPSRSDDISITGRVTNIQEALKLTITLFYKTSPQKVISKVLQIPSAGSYFNFHMTATLEREWPIGNYEYRLLFENSQGKKVLEESYPLVVK